MSSKPKKDQNIFKWVLLLILIIGLLLLIKMLFFSSTESVEVEFLGQKVKVNAKQTKNQLKDRINFMRNDKSYLSELIQEQEVNASLRSEIEKLKSARTQQIIAGETLAKQFEYFEDMSPDERNTLIIKTLKFIAPNSETYVDYGFKAEQMINKRLRRQLADKDRALQDKDTEIQRLKRELSNLSVRIKTIERQLALANSDNDLLQQKLDDLYGKMDSLRLVASNVPVVRDTSGIAALKKDIDDLLRQNRDLQSNIDKSVAYRTENVIFEPVGAKRHKKDKTFSLQQIDEIILQFNIRANLSAPPDLDSITVEIQIHGKDVTHLQRVIRKVDVKNLNQSVNIRVTQMTQDATGKRIDFGRGAYHAFAFYLNNKGEKIYLFRENFSVRKSSIFPPKR